MLTLSLPKFDYKVKKQSGSTMIYDVIRKKYVILSPEEWVRQHLIHYLMESKGIPATLIAVEREIQLYGLRRRFDVVVFDREGKPWLLVECKSPTVPLTRQVFDQAFRYNITLEAPYVAITNGVKHYCGKIDSQNGFLFLEDFPFLS
jgi:hypothetical protein